TAPRRLHDALPVSRRGDSAVRCPPDSASVHTAAAAGKTPTALPRPTLPLPTPGRGDGGVGRSRPRLGRRAGPRCTPQRRPGKRRPPYLCPRPRSGLLNRSLSKNPLFLIKCNVFPFAWE